MAYTILNISKDEMLLRSRAEILRKQGYLVVSAMDIQAVIAACENHKLDAIVVGHTIPLREKERISQTVREMCAPGIPIVALYSRSEAETDHCDYAVPSSEGPAELVSLLKSILPPTSAFNGNRTTSASPAKGPLR